MERDIDYNLKCYAIYISIYAHKLRTTIYELENVTFHGQFLERLAIALKGVPNCKTF